MNFKTMCYLLLFSIFSFSNAAGQEKKLPVKQLHQDVKFFFSSIKKNHPNAFAYYSPEVIDSVEKKIINSLKEPTSAFHLARIMEIETYALFDNHTRMPYIFINPIRFNYPEGVLFFPYPIIIKENNIYLESSKGDTKIGAINGHPAMEIIADMSKVFGPDASEQYKLETIEKMFPIYYYLFYLEHGPFNIILENRDGHSEQKEVPGITKAEVVANIDSYLQSMDYENEFSLQFFDDSIAFLSINTFDPSDESLYSQFLDNSFAEIARKGSEYLFVDIRKNGGGSSYYVSMLLNYLFPGEYHFLTCVFMKKITKEYFKQFDFAKEEAKKISEYFDFHVIEREKEVQHPFAGKIFLLQGSETRSASLGLSSAMRSTRRAIVIGEPTGEPAINYSQGLVFKLPNSGLYFQCASGYFIAPSGSYRDDLWFEPDIEFNAKSEMENKEVLVKLIENAREDYKAYFKKWK